jgi:tripartite ATP-independent transporter DctM subunit
MLAVPLFLLAAKIMNAGQITDRLFSFASCLVGHIKGGLAHVNVLASLLFAGMSGSAVADASGLGEIEIYAMTKRGFDRLFSGAITAASSCIGPIFPPSVPFLVYGGLAGVSIAKLFLAGALPGVLMAVLLMAATYVLSVKRDYPSEEKATLREILAAGRQAIFPLLSPAIILGCIVLGITTPTEASVIAVLYSLTLSLLYGTIKWRDIPRILTEVGVEAGCLMFIIASVSLFAWVITFYQIPHVFVEFVFSFTRSAGVIIMLTFAVLFIIGLFMNTTPGLIVSMPFLIPLAQQAGIDLVQFGVFSVLTLVIGVASSMIV